MKEFLRYFYLTSYQAKILISISKASHAIPFIGKPISILLDNLIFFIFSIELTSHKLDIKNLVLGHMTGVVLGGNGIKSNGTLHISSGVVFGGRYKRSDNDQPYMFEIDGDLTVGSNSVLVGPLKIKGPCIIGAMSLVNKDIEEPGTYAGIPARKIV